MANALTAAHQGYGLEVQPLEGTVQATRNGVVLARSENAVAMYETRLPTVIYFPRDDLQVPLGPETDLQTFCPFKGTASYHDITFGDEVLSNAVWSYTSPLPESKEVRGMVAFMPAVGAQIDLGANSVEAPSWGNISGPIVDWLLREAGFISSPEELTSEFAKALRRSGVSVARLSVMIWSLHPLIAGKNYIWSKDKESVSTYAPTYEIFDHPAFVNSPLRHVSNGRGGVRQKLGEDYAENSFPIMQDLQEAGATDYVAMPLPFSDGQINVLTITSDHPDGFSTSNLGLIFECIFTVSRYFEVFNQRENARSLLETYVGRRTGSRVLGGEIRRGDGDEIDAAILFCDLRDSTRLEEELGRDAYIALLNRFFETISDVVHGAGGEVLKFIGDAVLAVFPTGDVQQDACSRALMSARQIVEAFAASDAEQPIACAIGIEFGRVTYGNVGSAERLDFTVIGQAANVAARLCDHAKHTDHAILASAQVAASDSEVEPLGEVHLRNVSQAVGCFGVRQK